MSLTRREELQYLIAGIHADITRLTEERDRLMQELDLTASGGRPVKVPGKRRARKAADPNRPVNRDAVSQAQRRRWERFRAGRGGESDAQQPELEIEEIPAS